MNLITQLSACGLLLSIPVLFNAQAFAQSEGWLLGPNSGVGKESKIVPTNCEIAADGSITCDTVVRNPASDTQARPYYNPFND